VIAGMGIACLPFEATVDAVAVGRLKILETPFLDLRRRLSLLLHKARYRGMLIEAFASSLGIGAARPDENTPPCAG
jgi:DNA-binding transcriptional LysR family regulator